MPCRLPQEAASPSVGGRPDACIGRKPVWGEYRSRHKVGCAYGIVAYPRGMQVVRFHLDGLAAGAALEGLRPARQEKARSQFLRYMNRKGRSRQMRETRSGSYRV